MATRDSPFVARVDVPGRRENDARAVLRALEDFDPVVERAGNLLRFTLRLRHVDLASASRVAVAAVESASSAHAVRCEIHAAGVGPLEDKGTDRALMSVTQAASHLGISRAAVQKMIEAGRLATAQRVGKTWVISAADVHGALAYRRSGGQTRTT